MISENDVKKLATLARIKLSPEEETKLARDMESILGYVQQIQSVEIPEMSGRKERVRNVLRDDANPHESGIHTQDILNEAPGREGDYLKVKKIL